MAESSSESQSDEPESAPKAPSEPAPQETASAAPDAEAVTRDASVPPGVEGDATTKPKKKKKRRREAPAAPERDPLGPDGRERPAFVLDYPSDPELDRLVRAFELGNYAFVREHAPELAEKGKDARVRAAAAELARRIEPDPLVKVLLAMAVAFFCVLLLWAYKTHGN
jgi:hypothetical protein